MSAPAIGGAARLREALAVELGGGGDPAEGPAGAVVCWELPTGEEIDVPGLADALLTGLRAMHQVLDREDPRRIVHVVRTHGATPTAGALHAFVAAFTRSLAREEARSGTTVNAVGVEDGAGPGAADAIRALGPLVAFLAGPDSGWITGQALGATGAALARPGAAGPATLPDGATALVSGGAGAIGSAICRSLHARGWRVTIGYVTEGPAVRLAAALDSSGLTSAIARVDMADDEQAAAAAAALDPTTCGLVLCGGYSRTGRFATTDEAQWVRTLAVNLLGPARVVDVLAARWTEGVVVGIGSEAAKAGDAGRAVYAGAKAGLAALLAGVNRPGGGLRALTVAPGPIDTPMLRETHPTAEAAEEGIAKLRRLVPLRRLGTPEDIAAAVGLAMDPQGRALGGEVLSVGGGITMQ